MAPVGTVVDIVSFLYAFGNTPAVNFTQELAPESSARILLLGWGDMRNVLFTTYSNSNGERPLDFTCCDHETSIIARNFLLLTLILDDNNSSNTTRIWNIFYHLYLNDEDLGVLHCQAKKLSDYSRSMQTWNKSPYGGILRFQDDLTRVSVREMWESYCLLDLSKSEQTLYLRRLHDQIQQAKDFATNILGGGVDMSGIRSAAPVGLKAMREVTQIHEYFWKRGILSWDPHVLSTTCHPNPMIASPRTKSILHYGANPLLGFHLATAYINLTEDSPFYVSSSQHKDMENLVRAARLQLQTWSAAFRAEAHHTVLRVIVCDVFEICETLKRSVDSTRAGVKDVIQCAEYPNRFNVIDTSNVLDHVGSLNLLVAVAQLLENTHEATLHTDMLVKKGADLAKTTTKLLHGDFAAMTLLLGLFPVEYWTNASMVSPTEEILSAVTSNLFSGGKTSDGQAYCRLRWKKLPPSKIGVDYATLQVPSASLARLLYLTYVNMFEHENVKNVFDRATIEDKDLWKRHSYRVYHRGSFVTLVSYIKTRVDSDWPATISDVVRMIENDDNLFLGRNFIQELFTYLHLYGLYSTDVMEDPTRISHIMPARTSLTGWNNLPPVLCVTLKVPRSELKIFSELASEPTKLQTPFVYGLIGCSESYKGNPWQNCFAAVELCFGELIEDPSRGQHYAPHIRVDKHGWAGQSPLFLSFFVPSWILLLQPEQAVVAFALQNTPHAIKTFMSHLGPELIIYRTKQANDSEVFISESVPTLLRSDSGSLGGFLTKPEQQCTRTDAPAAVLQVSLSPESRLSSFTSRLNIQPGPDLKALRSNATVTVRQHGPLALLISINAYPKSFDYSICFPIPVSRSKCDIRIARKSAYIELIVRVDGASNAGEQDGLLALSYPSSATIWSPPHVNADYQPTVDVKQDLEWLNMHMALQMSDAERRVRENHFQGQGLSPSARINFKDSIFSLFMHFTGLKGEKAKIFGLSLPDAGGIHILLFVSKLKLDVGNHTAFLDAAVLPLTRDKMQPLDVFLRDLTAQRICQVRVDMDELKFWHQLLPIFAERCRTWKHKPKCEWKRTRSCATQWAKDQDPLCSCGRGVFPDSFKVDVPHWKVGNRHATRAAIAPLYHVPYVDKVFQLEDSQVKDIHSQAEQVPRCAFCGKSKSKDGIHLSACGRCKGVSYCSKACQTSDWKKQHKKSCRSV